MTAAAPAELNERWSVLWANTEPLYRAILAVGRAYLGNQDIASMHRYNDTRLGNHVQVQVRVWAATRALAYSKPGTTLSPEVWDEVDATIEHIDLAEFGSEIREALDVPARASDRPDKPEVVSLGKLLNEYVVHSDSTNEETSVVHSTCSTVVEVLDYVDTTMEVLLDAIVVHEWTEHSRVVVAGLLS